MENSLKQTKFCACKFTQKTENYWHDKTSDAKTNEPQLLGDAVAEICESCKRPIEKTKIIMQLVEVENA